MFSVLASTGLKVLMSMASSLMTEKFIKWALLKLAEQCVKSTATTADDEWFAEIKKQIEAGS